jgi:hypothetical protein
VASRFPVNPHRDFFFLLRSHFTNRSFADLSGHFHDRVAVVFRDPVGLRAVTRCGEEGTRTPDLLLAKQALYQLSYSPDRVPPTVCAYLDSNQGPQLYQSCALAN